MYMINTTSAGFTYVKMHLQQSNNYFILQIYVTNEVQTNKKYFTYTNL